MSIYIKDQSSFDTINRQHLYSRTIRHFYVKMRRIKIFHIFCLAQRSIGVVLLNSQQYIVFIKINFYVFRNSTCDFFTFKF